MEKLRPSFAGFPGVRIFFTSGGLCGCSFLGNENPIDVEILGYDFKIAEELPRKWRNRSFVPGAKDVRISREPDYPQQNIVMTGSGRPSR